MRRRRSTHICRDFSGSNMMDSTKSNPFIDSIVKLIESHGYPAEVYDNIKTDDGYFLTAYRIPHRTANKSNEPKPVVLLISGLISNSADYIIPGPNRGLAYVLCDQGYDIWLISGRGKKDSQKHVKYDPDKDVQYWNFSFHEMGIYDIPAVIDKIEEVTGLKTLSLIGHSQGTLACLTLLAEKPKYNKRVTLVVAVSPAAIISNMKSIPYRFLLITRHVWMTFLEVSGRLEIPPKYVSNFISLLFDRFAKQDSWFLVGLVQFLYLAHGRTQQFVKEYIPLVVKFYPDTTSVIVLKHLGELYRTGTFKKRDYGHQQNLQKYGTQHAPLYDLSKVMSPIVLFCSSGDSIVVPKDAKTLQEKLPNCIAFYEIEDPKFSHSDFLLGKYAVEFVFGRILEHLGNYCKPV